MVVSASMTALEAAPTTPTANALQDGQSIATGATGVVPAISTGTAHTCALLNTGQISCWGFGGNGQLGTGNTASLSTPSAPINLPTGTTATAIDTGGTHTCALLNTGQISCWGNGGNGQLGTGNTTNLSTPSAPITLPTGTTATAISTGGAHTCALLNTGQISCWGNGFYGRLGTGNTTDRSTPSAPITLPTGTTATAISTGGAHTCALLNTGQISCWGFGRDGQLGTGNTTELSTPSAAINLPTGTTATAISAGEIHTCALLDTGQISCWGDGFFGQLGTGNTTDLSTPSAAINLPTGTTATAISTGNIHTCAQLNTGQISCWGNGSIGQLGTGNTTNLSTPSAPITLPTGTTATAISAGNAHTCALLNTGQISCWGAGNNGRLGTGTTTSLSTPSAPITLPVTLTTAIAISAGNAHTCALLNTGQISCWGDGFFGQLGTGNTTSLPTPSAPITLPTGTTATAISTGNAHTCALLNTGQISCWGSGSFGRLGTGNTTSLSTPSAPITLPTGTTATAISTGNAHTCALLNTGQISCWGEGSFGQLGTGNTTSLSTPSAPITLPTGTTATAISTGNVHTCALLDTGQISCWGEGGNGRLGTGNTTNRSTPSAPITLPTGTTATAISTGNAHTCALLNTGQISCWGSSFYGQLGTGNTTDRSTPSAPITLPTGTTATAISTGGLHTCALLNTGQISCWGFGGFGRLGTGNTTSRSTPSAPITLPTGTTATAISAGNAHTCALLNTGQISCWGAGNNGRLGTGNTTSRSTPVLAGVPAVSITLAAGQTSPTAARPVAFTITFDQDVAGLEAADVTVAGTAGATTATLSGGPRVFIASIPTLPNDGAVDVSVNAGVASSLLGSTNTASNTATVTYDTTGPVATVNLGTGQTTPASITPVVFAVSFDEDVTGFDGTDIVVGGSAGATTGVVNGTGADYTITIGTVPNAGTVTLDVNAGAVTDAPGNASTTTIVANTVTFQTVPDAPTNASAGAGNQSATVSWTAPANTGGTLITGYRIEQSTNGTDWTPATTSTDTTTSTATTTTATGLTNNTAVQFRIAAINTIGTSTPSTPTTAVTPTTAPTVAVNPRLTRRTRHLRPSLCSSTSPSAGSATAPAT